ncbi:MAG: hypothetical protein WCO05_05155 [Candidatus Moraniibacteriota bacterium]
MKKTYLSAALAMAMFFFGSVSLAEETTIEGGGDRPFIVTGKISVHSSDTSEYTGEHISSSPLLKTEVTITHSRSKIYLSALAYVTQESVNEVDVLLGKSIEVGEATVDIGMGFYDIGRLGNMEEDFLAMYIGIEFPKIAWGIVPFVYLESNTPLRNEISEGGVLWKAGLKKSIEISEQPIEFKVEVGGNDGIYGTDPLPVFFARGTTSTEVSFYGVKIIPTFAVQKGFGGIAEEWRFIFGISIPF